MAYVTSSRRAQSDMGPVAAVVLLAILQILTPVLPALGIGTPIGEQSDSVRTVITPAGWAFSIWGALYSGSMLFAIFQALPAQRDNELLARVRWPAAGAFLGNAVWAAYTQVFGLSLISAAIIVFTLLCLLAAYRQFSSWQPRFTRSERWLAVLPLCALAAWLTVATIVNIAASLRFHGVEAGDAAAIIGAAVVVVGGAIAALALARGKGNPPYLAVFLWGLAGIYTSGGQESGLIAGATALAAVLAVIGAAAGWRRAEPGRWFG
jgi:hypothetical protein